MEIKYLVGIDFGHGETTVSYIDLTKIDKDMNIAEISEKIDHLRIVDNVGIDACVIDSVIYRKPNENGSYIYRLQKGKGYDTCTSFKSKISLLNRPNKKEEKEAFRNFIQLVYKNILENNKSILDQDGKNFLLYIASPTLWGVQDKEEYKRFVEDAIGRKVEWVINESDAAYYQKRQSSGLILVVDFGSSTIDFTLVYNNKKIDIDNLSNIQLGAQNVEHQMFSSYTTGIDTRNKYLKQKAISEGLLRKENMTYINLYAALLYNLRKKKEEVYKDGYGRRDEKGEKELYGFDWRYFFDFEKMAIRCNSYDCFFEDENSLLGSYIEDVKSLFQEVKTVIDQKCAPDDIQQLQLIVSGGASRMPWVREKLSEVFEIPLETIELKRDDRPEFIVSDGIVKYALAQYRVKEETFSLVSGFKDWLQWFFGNEEVIGIDDFTADEIEGINKNLVSLISDVCSDVYVNAIKSDERVLKYCSDTFEDEEKTMKIDDKEITYNTSSIRGFVYHIAKEINSDLLKKKKREEINKAIFERLKIQLRKVLAVRLNDIVFKLFNQKLIDCEVLKADQRVLPEITNNFTIGSDKFDIIAKVCLKFMSTVSFDTKDGFKIPHVIEVKGSNNKFRDVSERKEMVDAYCKFISFTFFKPYDDEKLNVIQSKIEEYVFPNIIDIVKNYLIDFYTCGYDLKDDILHDLKLQEQKKAKELTPATEKTL